jgi:hypothetical protein
VRREVCAAMTLARRSEDANGILGSGKDSFQKPIDLLI